jgi:hypothetical protein
MGRKTPAMLALLFLAAAPAYGDCPPNADSGQIMPRPLDLTGRPNVPTGLTGQTFKAPPGSEGANGCRGMLPSVWQPATSRSETADALHGLPAPDILDPIAESSRAPQIQ